MDSFNSMSNILIQDAESIIDNRNNKDLEYKQTYSVHIPNPEEQIILRKSVVKKIKLECERAKKNKFPWSELFLAISTLFLGAFLGALASQIAYEFNFLSIFYYTISPAGGIGFFVAYLLNRNKENQNIISLASKIEEYLLEIDDINNINGGE